MVPGQLEVNPNRVDAQRSATDEERALVTIVASLGAPASKPALEWVLNSAARCLDAVLNQEPGLAVAWSTVRAALTHSDLGPLARLNLAVLSSIVGRHPAWSLLGQLPVNASEQACRLVGAELLLAIKLGRVVRDRPLDIARRLALGTLDDSQRAEYERQARRYADRLVRELESYCTAEYQGISARDLLLDARIVACLVARSRSSLNGERERALAHLTKTELGIAIDSLVAGCKRGDILSAIQLTVFRMGLPQDIALDVCFVETVGANAVMYIDSGAGFVIVNVSRVFPDQAQVQGPNYKPTTHVIRLRLPLVAATVIHAAYCSDQCAQRLGDLVPKGKRITDIEIGSGTGAVVVTLPRLIASAGSSALEAGVDPALAAYITLQLGLIGHSAHSYFNTNRTEFEGGEDTWFFYLRLGAPTPAEPVPGLCIGAAATPTAEAVERIFKALKDQLDEADPGRRSGLPRLLLFHDKYARLVAFVCVLCLGARDEAPLTLQASAFSGDYSRVFYQHKHTGPSDGRSILPVPELLAMQITLWIAHLHRLDGRLSRMDQTPEVMGIRKQIQEVLDARDVPLLFQLTGGYRPLASGDIFSDLAEALHLKHDFSRHFFINATRKPKVRHEDAEAWMRHHHGRASTFSATSLRRQAGWMAAMASSIDRLAGELHIRAVVGLGR